MSKSASPLILVTGPDKGGWPAWIFTAFMIRIAGGLPKRVQPKHANFPDHFHGLVLGGGANVHPSRYNEQVLPVISSELNKKTTSLGRVVAGVLVWLLLKMFSVSKASAETDIARDELEWKVLEAARAKGVPILGICRGAQLINVFFGGSLYQSLESFYSERPNLRTVLPRKTVTVSPSSRLGKALEKSTTRVNSLHRQAIRSLGHDLVVTATEKNGVVQGIEHKTAKFLVGVQWHPELLPFVASQRRLFKNFVANTRETTSQGVSLG
jgi:putative glutamine amidotransferase